MANWVVIKNNGRIKKESIPTLEMKLLRTEIIKKHEYGMRVILFFGMKYLKTIKLFVVMADDESSNLYISSSVFDEESSYESITKEIPSFNYFEREFYEEFGIMPEGHPWLKPVRYSYYRENKDERMENYPFYKIDGEEIHEVGVGPVHAGVIEPGHFRFMCHGEKVINLEIQLGYQHRGIEKLMDSIHLRGKNAVHMSESIAGDTTIGHALTYAKNIESLTNVGVSQKSMEVRAILLELERIAVHIGDIGAILNDVAYHTGSAIFGGLRTGVINTSLAICGSRFGKGAIKPGGVRCDIGNDLKKKMVKDILKLRSDIEEFFQYNVLGQPSVLSRLEGAGIVDEKSALEIGLVGPAARASGISIDVRSDHPYALYRQYPVHKIVLPRGDVYSRTYIRYIEILQSINLLIEIMENMNETKADAVPCEKLERDILSISMTEGWRGEIVHAAVTNQDGIIERYKIKDPSFNNWTGLALAVKNNGISDFPLCNKSFNLSYCGFDL